MASGLKAFWIAIVSLVAFITFVVWRIFADKTRLDREARLAAVCRLGFYDVQQLKTPDEHREAFTREVSEATVALTNMKRDEIKARFEAAFGGGK